MAQQPFKGHFLNEDLKVRLELNLYNDSIPVPGLEMDTCYGYLQGNLNGTWVILKVISMTDEKAVVRASCDNGSESQNLELKAGEQSLVVRQVDGAAIKTIEGKKYVKLPKVLTLHR